MDPIRTAVKYSLIPLRTVVQLGELFVESGRETPPPPERTQAATKRRTPARKRTSPQATQTPKDLDDVALARKVETIIFRDDSVPKGKIDVNAADGVVWLRGEAKNPEMIKMLEREATAIPEWTHLSQRSKIYLSKTPQKTWSEAMSQLGAWLIAFRRRYGYSGDIRMAGNVPLADRDYEWAAPSGRLGRQGIPDRSGFGLPLPFGKHETVTWDSKEGESRRASPLLLHIERFGDDYVPVLTYLPARFVPAGQSLLYRGKGKKFAPTSQVLDVVERFLDDLQGKEQIEVIS